MSCQVDNWPIGILNLEKICCILIVLLNPQKSGIFDKLVKGREASIRSAVSISKITVIILCHVIKEVAKENFECNMCRVVEFTF